MSSSGRPHLSALKLKRWGTLALIVSSLLAVSIGSELSIVESWSAFFLGPGPSQGQVILWWIRLPMIISALLAGSILSLSGAAMQQLLRNDLADPYLIGVAAGGGLGAALALSFGWVDFFGLWLLPSASFLGALGASSWIEFSARRRDLSQGERLLESPERLVLTGVALNLFLSALLTLTLSLSEERLGGVWRWLVGHINALAWGEVLILSLSALTSAFLLFSIERDLSLMESGEEVAWSLGVKIKRVRTQTLIAVSLGVGAVVSFCGVIGFIGLIVPHMIRPKIIGEAQALFVLSSIYGALVLILCHILTLITPYSIPVGAVTGVIGGLSFLIMLGKKTPYS